MAALQHIRTLYQQSLAAHGDSPAGVQWPKGRQDLRFSALLRHLPPTSTGSLLDYGCGLGHLREYMAEHYPLLKYAGVDILADFLAVAKQRCPEASLSLIEDVGDLREDFDYIVASGVFNIRVLDDPEDNRAYVMDALRALFARCRSTLSVNFMSDQVDFQQPGAYHQNVMEIYNFSRTHLSPRLVIDHSDMPYEFTLTVWKDASIQRPDNIYVPV